MDIVYILGAGSLANDEEIKYSVRSLEKHMTDFGHVYVIGEYPAPLPRASHIAMPEPTNEKWKNAHLKTLRACEIETLSDDFILMHDDIYACADFSGENLPFYALSGVEGGPCGLKNYMTHKPIRLNKEYYKQMPFDIEQKACKSPRSFYANYYRAPTQIIDDFILDAKFHWPDYDLHIQQNRFFSISNKTMLNEEFCKWIETKYSTPSRYERNEQ